MNQESAADRFVPVTLQLADLHRSKDDELERPLMFSSISAPQHSSNIADVIEARRLQLIHHISTQKKSSLGQFFTPVQIARLVASKFAPVRGTVRLLDAGAGIGSLTAAFVERILDEPAQVSSCELTAYEVDETLVPLLQECLEECCRLLVHSGIPARYQLHRSSFIDTAKDYRPSFLLRQRRITPTLF